MKRLLVWLMVLGMLLTVPVQAEDDDISAWLAAQEATDAQLQWAAYYGVDVDTSQQAQNITKKCKFKVSEGSRDRLTNGKVGSPWKYDHSDAWIGITLPEDITPGCLRIEWMFDPTGYELIEYDAAQQPLRTRTQADTFPSIYTVYPLDPQTRTIQLKMTAEDQGVSNIAVYSAGILPADVQTWLPPVEKADMMVFSTHQDDEVIFLGGTIPYSDVVCARPTITVYMANCSRDRRREALECLWEMGSRHYPEFINMKDEKVSSVEKGIKLWGGKENILKEIVARIRRYKPEVIVTQDLEGEYGHNQHKIVASAMEPAIEAAADPNQYPESCQEYGTWQVKKLYLHLYKENQIHMDWNTPLDVLGGLTLLKVAQNGMEKHASQTKYFKVRDGGKYDNASFGLAFTTVGEDVQKNDFFENIPLNASAVPLEETEVIEDAWEDAEEETTETTEEPTKVDNTLIEEMPTEEPLEMPQSVSVEPEPASETGGDHRFALAGIVALGAAALGGGAWALMEYRGGAKKKKHRKKKKGKKKATSKNGRVTRTKR